MNAAVVSLAFGNPIWYQLAAVWGKTLKEVGTSADCFVIVPTDAPPDFLRPLIEAEVAYRHEDLWETPFRTNNRKNIVTKLNVLKYEEYDRIYFCDADMYWRSTPDVFLELPQAFYPGEWSPLHDGRFIITPNRDDFEAISYTLQRGVFDPVDGWEGVGKFEHPASGEIIRWDFNGAEASQGLLFHRFHFQKKTYRNAGDVKKIGGCCVHTKFNQRTLHTWRRNPKNAEYLKICRRLGHGGIAGDKPKRSLGESG